MLEVFGKPPTLLIDWMYYDLIGEKHEFNTNAKKNEKYEGFLENKAVCLKSNMSDERLLKAIDCLPVQCNGTGLEIHI